MMTPAEDPAEIMRTVARPVANLGNTCYMNAVLQALAHAPELCLAMDCESHRASCPIAMEKNEKKRSASPDGSTSSHESGSSRRSTRKSPRSGKSTPPDNVPSDSPSFCALCELEEHLRSVHDSSQKDTPVSPESFVQGFVDYVAPWFKIGVQEDSHEFLRLLIDAMQKSCERARPSIPRNLAGEVSDDENGRSSPRVTRSSARAAAKKESEYPFSLFRGTVESTVVCSYCSADSTTLDPIEDIGLEVSPPVPSNANSRSGTERTSRNVSPVPAPVLYDVETAFQRFSQPETLDSGYKCEKCGRIGKATKESRLASIPPILTLHLKRFRYGAGVGNGDAGSRRASRSELGQLLAGSELYGKSGSAKIEGHVKFPVLLNLQPFLTEDLQTKSKGNTLCRLFAVIVHAGANSHSGHYVSFVRHLTRNEWWKCDDGRVTLVTVDEVCRQEAYMLFYRVVQHPVTNRLESRYKVMMESRPSPKKVPSVSSGAAEIVSGSEDIKRLRKRAIDACSVDGEEWAISKRNMPPHLQDFVQLLQEKGSESQTINDEFLHKVAKYLGGRVSSLNNLKKVHILKNGIQDNNVEGGTELSRAEILAGLYDFARWLEETEGISTEDWIVNPPTGTSKIVSSLENIADEQRVAVVEPEEEMTLL